MPRLPLFILAGLLAVSPTLAAPRNEHRFSLKFSSTAPNAATGVSFSTDRFAYKAPPQGTPADRVATTTFIMHAGAKTNLAAYPKCSKSGLEARGPMACPAGSRVGSGEAFVITGLPIDPVVLKAQIFVAKNGLLAYLEGSGQRQVIAMTVNDNKIVATVPRKCLPEGQCKTGVEAVLKKLTIKLNKGKLIKTPPKCPASGVWVNKVTYKYVNGDTETQKSKSSCKR